MLKIFLLPLFLLGCSTPAQSDFYQYCMGKKRSEQFDALIKVHFEEGKKKLALQNKTTCRKLAKQVAEEKSVVFNLPLDQAHFLQMFPGLDALTITLETPVKKLNIGKLPKLFSFMVTAPLALPDLGDLIYSTQLKHLTIAGKTKPSWVDLEQLRYFPQLTNLILIEVTAKNAKAIEKLPQLEFITLKDVKLDQKIDWSRLPKLLDKRIISAQRKNTPNRK